MQKKRLVINRRFIILLFVVIANSIVFLAVISRQPWRFDDNIKMTQFSICSGLDTKGIPIPVTQTITINTKEIHICGYLKGNDSTIPLIFYLENATVKPITGNYKHGYIMVSFIMPSNTIEREYRVSAYSERHELASFKLTVSKQ